MKEQEKTNKDKKKKRPVVPVCEENKYIEQKRIKEGTGLSPDAKILME